MLCLNCNDVNQELSARAARLADKMIQYVVDQNRDKNRGYDVWLEQVFLLKGTWWKKGTSDDLAFKIQISSKKPPMCPIYVNGYDSSK